MSKFQNLFNTLSSQLVSEAGEQPPTDPSVDPSAQQQPQVPAPQEVQPPQSLTAEGKKFLIELALKALGVGPEKLTATDKSIFGTEVTQENADEILKRIQTIVDLYS